MDCQDCLERLFQYLDKELSPEEVTTVRLHLDDCRGCSNHFYFEARFIEKIRDVGIEERAPERLRERIVLRFREGYATHDI